ncbi:MAG TPA: hypothetical protein VND97_06555, partial [Beijerinckiaceae bacterium]|nr:hypothetical protein [Beijerinckiaceae bacterium]
PGLAFDFADPNPHRTYGEIGGDLQAFQIAGHWSGFVKGDLRFASAYHADDIKGGLRYQW